MVGGSVSVSGNGAISKSGLAGAIFDALQAADNQRMVNTVAFFDDFINSVKFQENSPDAQARFLTMKDTAILDLLRSWAVTATAVGQATVAYLQANATVSLASVKATVSTGTSVGRTPNPNNPATPISPPTAAVDLPVTGAGGATDLSLA